MRVIIDCDLPRLPCVNDSVSSPVGISKCVFDYANNALKEYPRKEFIKIRLTIQREPENGQIAFDFVPE